MGKRRVEGDFLFLVRADLIRVHLCGSSIGFDNW